MGFDDRVLEYIIANPRKLEHGFWRFRAILYLIKGMRRMMFQLSGFYYKGSCKDDQISGSLRV